MKDVENLIPMLADPSWVVRRSVIQALAEHGPFAVDKLLQTLVQQRDSEARIAAVVDTLVASTGPIEAALEGISSHPDPAVLADVAQILGRRRKPKSVDALIRLIKHPDDNVAVAAIEGLGRIGGRSAVEALIQIIKSDYFFRTFPAIDVLGRSADPRAVEPLVTLLSNSSYLPEAARALGRTGEKSAVVPLIALFDSPSQSTIRLAAVSLFELQEKFNERTGKDAEQEELTGMTGTSRVIAELVRNRMGTEATHRLARTLANSDTAEAVAICWILGAVGNSEVEPQLSAALSRATPVALSAAEALKRIGSNSKKSDEALLLALGESSSTRRKALLPVITQSTAAHSVALCLSDPDPEVRALACDVLGRLGNPIIVRRIFPLLSDPNLRVVHAATGAIQALGSRETQELAEEAASSPNPSLRRSALRILSYFGNASALNSILSGMEDENPKVQEAAIQGLPYLEDPRALDALLVACKHPLPKLRALAMRSLGQVPKASEHVYSLLLKGLSDTDAWVRYYSAQALGRLSYAPAARDLALCLRDPEGQVRVGVLEALSHLDVPEAYEILREVATSEDLEMKRAALIGLGIGRRAEDLPVLLEVAKASDAGIRLVALSAIASFSSPTALHALSHAALDSDAQVRAAAIGFLAGRHEEEATRSLVELLMKESSHDRAKAALRIPSDGRVPGILSMLEDSDDNLAPILVSILVSILAQLEKQEGTKTLLIALNSSNKAARKAVASALALDPDSQAQAALEAVANNDPSPEVREICSLLIHP